MAARYVGFDDRAVIHVELGGPQTTTPIPFGGVRTPTHLAGHQSLPLPQYQSPGVPATLCYQPFAAFRGAEQPR